MDLPSLLILFICLMLAGFFSGTEVAYLFSNKLQIEIQEKQGIFVGKVFARFTKNNAPLIATLLVGKTISLVLFGVFFVRFADPLIRQFLPLQAPLIYAVTALISTLIILFTVELLSYSLFITNPNKVLSFSGVPVLIFYVLLFPVVYPMIWLYRKINLAADAEYPDTVFGLSAFSNYVKNINKANKENNIELDTKIFHKALEFKTVRVRECMIPRTEIVAVSLKDELQKLKNAFVESGHSKIIVYKESIDDVIGYCHSSALFKKPKAIQDILTPIIVVPETTLANELMIRFINERKSLAIVIDEFGGTSGLASMEDVIEEIFGNIEDEHDEDDLIEQKLDEFTYLLSARLEIDYLNDTYNWNLPAGDYDTLGGLILNYTEEIPKPGQTISIAPFIFVVQSTSENRINLVKMVMEPPVNTPERA